MTLPAYQAPMLKLGAEHRQILSLLAQGVSREEVATITGYAPQSISRLLRDPLCKEYLQQMMDVVEFRLTAMTEKSVQAIEDELTHGNGESRMRAAKLQMEAIGRIGSKRVTRPADDAPDRLDVLADRLVKLLDKAKGNTYEGTVTQQGVLRETVINPESGEEVQLTQCGGD